MGAGRDAFLAEAAAAARAASCSADPAPGRLPPFERAIVVPEELPEMPAEVVEGVLLETHKMLLTGPSKAGKTWGLINLAVSVATGGWWVDFRCARRRVLYVDLETDPRTLQRRVAAVAAAKGADAAAVRAGLSLWPLRGRSCGLAEIAAELLGRCGAGDFGMVVIDPAYMVQDGDENNARDIREFFARLDEICVGLRSTVVVSHHHSKGSQGMKSSIDRGSGSGVFGRAPDAVLDLTELALEPGTLEAARQSARLAQAPHLSAWRMSFTLREFAPRPPLDLWFRFPLHERDATGLLADCRPAAGGAEQARRARAEGEALGKVAALDAACERLIGDGAFCFRDDLQAELRWSQPTVARWLGESRRFRRSIDPATSRACVVRADGDGGPR
jgi:RecA-family ATPase